MLWLDLNESYQENYNIMVQLNGREMWRQRLNYFHQLNDIMKPKNSLEYVYEILCNMHININMQYLNNKTPKWNDKKDIDLYFK